MPRFIQAKSSTQHRVAAIALYRALLQQCSSASLLENDRVSLRHAIQNKFRKNRKIQSQYQLSLSFKAGYELLDKLDASTTGDSASTDSLTQLISRLPHALKRPPFVYYPGPRPPEPPNPRSASLPPERAVLNVRPYAKTSGPRHVPVLASATGVPFLRLGKPQPLSLSRVLYQRHVRKQAIFEQKVSLSNWDLPLCQQEDEWDTLINMQLVGEEDEVSWVDAVHSAIQENQTIYFQHQRKDRLLSQKMLQIVDQETELALKEGQTIVRGRKRRPLQTIKPNK